MVSKALELSKLVDELLDVGDVRWGGQADTGKEAVHWG